MRHFSHHIGDYASATAHLSFVEDAAYHRCLRRYYQDEKPLPIDLSAVQRLVGARTKEERAAVENVLGEFFTLRDDGWHQKRTDEEIAAYQVRVGVARENGRKSGGRPKPTNNQSGNQVGLPRDATEEPNPNHTTQLTNNHEPVTINQGPDSDQSERELAPSGAPPAQPIDDLTLPSFLKRSTAHGERLSRDWQPSQDEREFASDQGLDPELTAATFCDYWHAQPGAKGRKVDWPATWRNWCRREAAGHVGPRKAGAVQASRGNDAFYEQLASIAAKDPD